MTHNTTKILYVSKYSEAIISPLAICPYTKVFRIKAIVPNYSPKSNSLLKNFAGKMKPLDSTYETHRNLLF